jgi:hypothetical protein
MAKTTKNVTPKTVTAKPARKVVAAAKKLLAPAFSAKTAKEITATFVDSMGLTAKVAAALATEDVNILAGTGYSASGTRRKIHGSRIKNDAMGYQYFSISM